MDDDEIRVERIFGYARVKNDPALWHMIDPGPPPGRFDRLRREARELWGCVIAPALVVAVGVAFMFVMLSL